MSYFIFNGKDSRDIEGLIVQELPPITKPLMRYEKTEIDGLDGDILDYKGYSAYDKTISIGLARNYDLNTIINWLQGSGKLILSNEEDKYYIAEVVNNIDFKKLLIFKTANITFHVQPFKYLFDEAKQSLNITTQTEFNVVNQGLLLSKPIIKLTGTGIVEIAINDISVFSINIDDEEVTVDCQKQDAYKGTNLKNRQMNGDFENILLNVGTNKITWTGNLTKIEVDANSRWL